MNDFLAQELYVTHPDMVLVAERAQGNYHLIETLCSLKHTSKV